MALFQTLLPLPRPTRRRCRSPSPSVQLFQVPGVRALIGSARLTWDRPGDACAFSGGSPCWVIRDRTRKGGKCCASALLPAALHPSAAVWHLALRRSGLSTGLSNKAANPPLPQACAWVWAGAPPPWLRMRAGWWMGGATRQMRRALLLRARWHGRPTSSPEERAQDGSGCSGTAWHGPQGCRVCRGRAHSDPCLQRPPTPPSLQRAWCCGVKRCMPNRWWTCAWFAARHT